MPQHVPDDAVTREALRTCGQILRARRHALGWTLEECARKIDISVGPLSQQENGRKWLYMPAFLRLARVLGLPMALLFPCGSTDLLHRILALLPHADADMLSALDIILRDHVPSTVLSSQKETPLHACDSSEH